MDAPNLSKVSPLAAFFAGLASLAAIVCVVTSNSLAKVVAGLVAYFGYYRPYSRAPAASRAPPAASRAHISTTAPKVASAFKAPDFAAHAAITMIN